MAGQVDRRNFLRSMTYGAAALSLPKGLTGLPLSLQNEFTGLPLKGEKPNIVVIFADDMGYGDMSCQSIDDKIQTPNMDRLAAQGMRFTDAHSSSAVCTPSRYSLLTGRYNWRSRLKRSVLGGFDAPLIDPKRTTIASLLKKHGYKTACIGKWHLGLGWRTKDGQVTPWKDGKKIAEAEKLVTYAEPLAVSPNDYGFDYSYVFPAALDMPPYLWIENGRVVEAPTAYTKGGDVQTAGYWRPGPIAPSFKHVEVLPDITHRTVNYIDQNASKSSETPFFLYVPISAPHWPVAPAEFVKGKSKAGAYGDFIMEIDWTVGEIMGALEKNGIVGRTLVIFTSDNGSPAMNGPTEPPYSLIHTFQHYPNGKLRGIKADIWDGGHREPFVVRWPGIIPAGAINGETICLTDLMATFAGIVGGKLPADAGEDSCNLLPSMLLGQKAGGRVHETTVHHSVQGMYAIRSGPWKLIMGVGDGGWMPSRYRADPDDPEGQLYNMDVDLEEKDNLYDQYPDIVRNLTMQLQEIKFQGHS